MTLWLYRPQGCVQTRTRLRLRTDSASCQHFTPVLKSTALYWFIKAAGFEIKEKRVPSGRRQRLPGRTVTRGAPHPAPPPLTCAQPAPLAASTSAPPRSGYFRPVALLPPALLLHGGAAPFCLPSVPVLGGLTRTLPCSVMSSNVSPKSFLDCTAQMRAPPGVNIGHHIIIVTCLPVLKYIYVNL